MLYIVIDLDIYERSNPIIKTYIEKDEEKAKEKMNELKNKNLEYGFTIVDMAKNESEIRDEEDNLIGKIILETKEAE